MLNTPVLFIVFNRPDTTRQVFEAIRRAQPRQLFVAADGPRADREGEAARCEEVRKIATAVDWDCEFKTLFRDENLGCGLGPKSAIDWFFSSVTQGIILEDDCLPNMSFFKFCQELLDYYSNDSDIMHISGNNFLFGKKFSNDSYYFSKYTHNWGWATWKRAWKHFNFNIDDFEMEWESISNYYKLNEEENMFWVKTFSEIESGRTDVWDAQWLYSVWKSKGYSILPSYNLVTNIGFSSNATHTFQLDSPLSNIKTVNINSLIHPISYNINIQADYISFRKIFLLEFKSSLINRAINLIKRKLFLK